MYTEKDEQRIEHVAEQGGLRLNLVEIPAGFPKENTPNAHEGEECHLVLRGKLEVQHGEDIAIVEEGDSFSWNACVPHIVRNIGKKLHYYSSLAMQKIENVFIK